MENGVGIDSGEVVGRAGVSDGENGGTTVTE